MSRRLLRRRGAHLAPSRLYARARRDAIRWKQHDVLTGVDACKYFRGGSSEHLKVALSAFDDGTKPPTEHDLRRVLGKTYTHWTELQRRLCSGGAPLSPHWAFTGRATGWGMRLKRGDRIIVYMTPCEGHFLASFALGERAVAAARAGDLPVSLMAIIDASKKYAEGLGVRFVVKTAADVRNAERLAAIKMAY